MKKLILLCLVFIFSNTTFAQDVKEKASKTKAKTEKAVKAKKEKADKLKEEKAKAKKDAEKAAKKTEKDAKAKTSKAKKEVEEKATKTTKDAKAKTSKAKKETEEKATKLKKDGTVDKRFKDAESKAKETKASATGKEMCIRDRLGILQRVNTSDSYYLKSKLIQNKKTNLSLFVNYRRLKYTDITIPTEPSLNSRLLYNDNFFNQLIQTTVAYETASGTIAQQEFTYLEVNPGQGVYMWNDYNLSLIHI